MPVGPPDRLGGGAVAPYHQAKQGGQRDTWRSCGGEDHRELISRTGWQEILVGSCLMQHAMAEMNPRMRLRLGHAKELPLYFLKGILFHLRQHQEECVGYCGSGTRVIRPVAADRARLPITGMVWHVGHNGLRKRRQQRLEFLRREAGHRASTPGTWGNRLVAWPRHLRHSVIGREA
jgi:hypothetical protein